MSANPASEILSDPLEYYEPRASRRISRTPPPKGVHTQPQPADPNSLSTPSRSSSRCKKVMDGCLGMLRCLENIPVIGHLVASGYLMSGKKDQAERAGLKATVGLACCVFNFPAEVVDELTAKRSPRLDSPGLMDRRRWMKRHHRRQLRHLCLPGSHQSGTYHISQKMRRIPLVEGWSRCQQLSVQAQLCGGIRFFDFRIMTHENQIWLHHNVVACIRLREALQEVKDFVTDNPSEIVFIFLDRDGKDVNWTQVQVHISELFGDTLIMEHMKDMLIADIVNQGRNVVICGVPNAAYCWRGIQHHWPNRPWPEQLRADLEATLTEVASRPPDRLFWYKAECTPDTSMVVRNLGGVPGLWAKSKGGLEKFEFLEDMAASANHAVYEVLQGVEHLPFNVLSTDFVQDDIVGLIVQLNDNAEEGRFTANESAEALDEVFAAEDTSMLVASTRGQHKLSSSHSSVSTARSNMNTSFDIRLQPAPPIELKETNM